MKRYRLVILPVVLVLALAQVAQACPTGNFLDNSTIVERPIQRF
jgi:hypothetical protein